MTKCASSKTCYFKCEGHCLIDIFSSEYEKYRNCPYIEEVDE